MEIVCPDRMMPLGLSVKVMVFSRPRSSELSDTRAATNAFVPLAVRIAPLESRPACVAVRCDDVVGYAHGP
eukprot:3568617-Rhodomonas_salina.4